MAGYNWDKATPAVATTEFARAFTPLRVADPLTPDDATKDVLKQVSVSTILGAAASQSADTALNALRVSSGAGQVGTSDGGNVQSYIDAVAGPSGAGKMGFTRSGISAAILRMVDDKLRDLPHLYDLISAANRTPSYDAKVELQAALNSGERFVLPRAEVRFSGTLNANSDGAGFVGQGWDSVLKTTSATGDVFVLGDGTNERSNIQFQDLTLLSSVTRTSGHAFWSRKNTDCLFDSVRIGSRDDYTAAGNVARHYNGIFSDRFSNIVVNGGEIVASNECIKVAGNSDQTYGAELTLTGGLLIYKGAVGLHMGGGVGGLRTGEVDISACGIGILIDEALAGAYNRECLFGSGMSIDSCTTANVKFNLPTSSVGRFIFYGTWSCGSSGPGIWVATANGARIQLNGHFYANQDGVKIDDANAYVIIQGGSLFDLNTQYGINPTVVTSRLFLAPGVFFLANGSGGSSHFNATSNAFQYDMTKGLIHFPSSTVATLPPAAGNADTIQVVTDANARTADSVVAGGGTNRVFVKCDGANWRIL